MGGEQDDQHPGHERDVDEEEARERFLADRGAAEQQLLELLAIERHGASDFGAHSGRPIGELVPRQQVAREAEHERAHEQEDADDPGELAWLLERAHEVRAGHVEHDGQRHERRTPGVDLADQPAEADFAGDVLDGLVRLLQRRAVVEQEQNAGDELAQEREQCQAAEDVQPAGVRRQTLVELFVEKIAHGEVMDASIQVPLPAFWLSRHSLYSFAQPDLGPVTMTSPAATATLYSGSGDGGGPAITLPAASNRAA